ncbi:MAG: hypothetical protein Kow00121_01520 [Elainellaceae cyanobacterium]
MSWLPGFFSRKKSQSPQPVNNAEATNSTTVMQILAEETIMAVAQWLVTFVNRSFQHKQNAQNAPVYEEPGTGNQAAPLEELLSKFSILIEQLHEREQGVTPLQNRINEIEASLKKNGNLEQYTQNSNQVITALEERLMQVENQIQRVDIPAIETSFQKGIDLEQYLEQRTGESNELIAGLGQRLTSVENVSEQVNVLVENLDQAHQTIEILESRIDHLEKLLARFSVVPKLVEGNYRAIVSLQNRLDPTKTTSKNSLRVVSH